jgi:translocation and assembly module TamA
VAVLVLQGCGHLRKEGGDKAAAAASYDVDVDAPDELRALLLAHLDLVRLRSTPEAEGVGGSELDRLVAAAPAQARALLETEGYYASEVRVTRTSPAGGLPLVQLRVEPGPRTVVDDVEIEVTGDLHDAAQAGDADAVRTLAALRQRWSLRPGEPLRAAAWNDAKKAALQSVRAAGWAAATWSRTEARIDADAHRAQLRLAANSGPRYRLGAITVDGLQRYSEEDVRRLAEFGPGQPYTAQALRDYQDRLQKANLFESVVVEIDPEPATHEAAPVHVRVKEIQAQQATVGLGYADNNGFRVTLEHTNRKLFGNQWTAKNKFELGPLLQKWTGEFTSRPLDDLYRNFGYGEYERERSADEWRTTWTTRAGRRKDTKRIDRAWYAEWTHSRVDTAAGTEDADALSLNYYWAWRHVDDVLIPTDGITLSAQGGAGHAVGHHLEEQGIVEGRGPFARAQARLLWYKPFPADDAVVQRWYLTTRVEAGEVFARDDVSVPDSLLFRAGGDESVRGYEYRTLGPVVNGVVTSGRMLATASVEIARPISPKRPQFLWAAFIDAGNAANRWHELHPALGYGVGLRWRSPIGSMRVDVAYGQDVHKTRVHVSVGVVL